MKNLLFALSKVLLFVYSVALALGTWNPFVPYRPGEESSGFDLAQVISVLFIGTLFIVPKQQERGEVKYHYEFMLFFLVLLATTVFNNAFAFSMSDALFFVKLGLVLSLCYFLPRYYMVEPRLMFLSAFVFSLVCGLLAMAYTAGLLDNFLILSKGRVSFWGENSNSTSARYVMAFLFLFYLIMENPLEWSRYRYFLLALLPPILNLIIATGSRGSFLILVFCILFYVFFMPVGTRATKLYALLVIPALLFVLIVFFMSRNAEYSLLQRLTDSIESGEDAGREELNTDAIDVFMDHPFTGTGIDKFKEEMQERFNEQRTAHNLYVYLLSISGILGFSLFFSFLWKLLRKSYEIRAYTPIALTLLLYMLFLAYKTGGILTYMLMWYVFAMVVTFINLSAAEQEENELEPEEELQ